MQLVAWVEHSDTRGTLSRVSLRSTQATDYLCFSPAARMKSGASVVAITTLPGLHPGSKVALTSELGRAA